MDMVRLNIQFPLSLKAKLDALRAHGTTASGFIRTILERETKKTGVYKTPPSLCSQIPGKVMRYRSLLSV